MVVAVTILSIFLTVPLVLMPLLLWVESLADAVGAEWLHIWYHNWLL